MWDPPTEDDRPTITDKCGYRPVAPPVLLLVGEAALIILSPWSILQTLGLMFLWVLGMNWLHGHMLRRHLHTAHVGAHTIIHTNGSMYSRDPFARLEK